METDSEFNRLGSVGLLSAIQIGYYLISTFIFFLMCKKARKGALRNYDWCRILANGIPL